MTPQQASDLTNAVNWLITLVMVCLAMTCVNSVLVLGQIVAKVLLLLRSLGILDRVEKLLRIIESRAEILESQKDRVADAADTIKTVARDTRAAISSIPEQTATKLAEKVVELHGPNSGSGITRN